MILPLRTLDNNNYIILSWIQIKGSSLWTSSPLKEQVYNVFTTFTFKKISQGVRESNSIQNIWRKSRGIHVQHYKEQHSQKHIKFCGMVMQLISCSCKNFEFWGILCCHVLTIFLHMDYFQVSIRYLPLRWCRDEFHRQVEAF